MVVERVGRFHVTNYRVKLNALKHILLSPVGFHHLSERESVDALLANLNHQKTNLGWIAAKALQVEEFQFFHWPKNMKN